MKKLFMITFMARSGSKFLRSLLNQHPQINDHGEIFHDRSKMSEERNDLLRLFSKITLDPHPVPGFQFRYPRHYKEFPEVKDALLSCRNSINVVLLQRKSKIKGAVSQQNAEKIKKSTGKAHLFKGSSFADYNKLILDVPRAIRETLQREQLDNEYYEWASKHFSTLLLNYEDLCVNTEFEIARVCEFTGLMPLKPGNLKQSDLVKITSDNLKEAIQNYDELYDELDRIQRLDLIGVGEQSDSVPDHFSAANKFKDSKLTPSLVKRWITDKIGNASLRTQSNKEFEVHAERPLKNQKIALEVHTLSVKTGTRFLEHVTSLTNANNDQYVVCMQEDTIIIVNQHGKVYKKIEVGQTYQKCFTMNNGIHLLQKSEGTVYRYDKDWKHMDTTECGKFPWHGSWSIDQNQVSGTVIWAEYPYAADQVKVWRSINSGKSWDTCFVQNGGGQDPHGGEIRHFHVVQKCSTYSNRWYLSSGDTESQTRFWVSDDDGVSWAAVKIANVINGDNIPQKLLPRLHRFTSLIQTDSHLYFPTDDTFKGRGACVCKIPKDKLDSIEILTGACGKNEIRNFIRLTKDLGLVVSESKLDRKAANLTLVDFGSDEVLELPSLPNTNKAKSNFMNSLSSKNAQDNIFFSYSDNQILRPSKMTLRWVVKITGEGPYDTSSK
ncbi:hypothetical protein [Desulfoluna spongiiphila]|uniref:hypothetical protein n=1 Tax=Desulfoluna spongiiphila TaxID=419481 RepID=UPI0012537B44|nr:hypothetical protein [Desulfoluna spongiiphila]VVS92356.1 p-loop containing nucleoside triphosphate hydrolase [Desulfoluna spongiiphila]